MAFLFGMQYTAIHMKNPILLAIETSTQNNACAFICAQTGVVLCEQMLTSSQTPSEDFLPMLDALCVAHSLEFSSCRAIAITVGPGSFTGIRFGIGLAQGFAFALGIPIVPISTLVALAACVPATQYPILSILDARMGECYWGLTTATGTVEGINRPQDIELPESLSGCIALGNGFNVYPELKTRLPVLSCDPDAFPKVSDVARLGLAAFLSGQAIPPEKVQPNYLRIEVASLKGHAK